MIEQPDDSPGFLLWQVTLSWQRDIATALLPFGLTHVQFVLLASTWWFNRRDEQPTQVALATHAGADVKMVSQVVRTLERKGLVTREVDAADTRARRLVATDAGAKLAPLAVRAVEAVDAALLQRLSPADAAKFTVILRELRGNASDVQVSDLP